MTILLVILVFWAVAIIFLGLVALGATVSERRREQQEAFERHEAMMRWIGDAIQTQTKVPRVLVHRPRGFLTRQSAN